MEKVIVKKQVGIDATVDRVWEVLIDPAYIRQWDELPENYGNENLTLGSVIEWEGHVKLTVTAFEPNRLMRMSAVFPKVALDPGSYDVSYTYSLETSGTQVMLSIEIGDFAPLPNPQDYHDASLQFAGTASHKIKELAEKH